ncbi:alanyl-tRNA editing protein [Acidianus sulfidivorans JP7]|uniref:Alanyl-tRNA editing protein AlaX n=1 Tax=Acidianus sulfidivorans JP7 TaxID=619593 RepID=A0A2U9IN59_9CREN|nr:alanyl-tRNA editing protein [Acidianus sulfidivorans]AWR97384.1 alanyl-tRNA editing protein [Acidianus sulfidivorans JP7]
MDNIEIRTHSALHVLKGASRKVLNTIWTASTYVNGPHGRLTVKSEKRPSEEEIEEVFKEANKKILEGAPFIVEKLLREEAEKKYGTEIYDLFPVPEEIKELYIVIIPNWNINACNKPHVSNTKEIGEIKLDHWRYRNAKQLLELSFNVI